MIRIKKVRVHSDLTNDVGDHIAAYADADGEISLLTLSSLAIRQLKPGSEHPVDTLMLTVLLLSPFELRDSVELPLVICAWRLKTQNLPGSRVLARERNRSVQSTLPRTLRSAAHTPENAPPRPGLNGVETMNPIPRRTHRAPPPYPIGAPPTSRRYRISFCTIW